MQANRVMRALLALIFLCLLVLVFKNFFGNDEQAPSAQSAPGLAGKSAQVPGVAGPAPPVAPLKDSEVQLFIDTLSGSELAPEIRAWTARQLGATEGPEVTQALLDALDDPSPEVVDAAAEALAERDDPRVGPALEKLRRDRPQMSPPNTPEGMRIETLD
jgi:hypothetical protein